MAKGAGRPCSLSLAAALGAREEVVVRQASSRLSGFRGFGFVGGKRRRARRTRCSRFSASPLLTSARRIRRRCWLEVCTGAGRGGRCGGQKGTFRSRSAARGHRPVREPRCRRCCRRETHCSCRLPTLRVCVREASVSSKVRGGRRLSARGAHQGFRGHR